MHVYKNQNGGIFYEIKQQQNQSAPSVGDELLFRKNPKQFFGQATNPKRQKQGHR